MTQMIPEQPTQVEAEAETSVWKPARRITTFSVGLVLVAILVLTALLAPGFTPQRWNNGPDFWLLQARDEATLRSPAFTAAAARVAPGDDFMAFAFTRDGDSQLAVRGFFTVKHGLIEDPVTGSANALVAACLHRRGELPANPYLASQGRELGRDGKVQVRVDAEGDVWIGGHVQPVIDGRIDW